LRQFVALLVDQMPQVANDGAGEDGQNNQDVDNINGAVQNNPNDH